MNRGSRWWKFRMLESVGSTSTVQMAGAGCWASRSELDQAKRRDDG